MIKTIREIMNQCNGSEPTVKVRNSYGITVQDGGEDDFWTGNTECH